MVRGVEVRLNCDDAFSYRARKNNDALRKGASRFKAEDRAFALKPKPSKFELAQRSLSSILEGRFVALRKL
jgi:hypothetical protein